MMDYKLQFIEFMVRSGVLTFGDFVTKSGRNTPYFVNTGNYRTGRQASLLGEFYSQCIIENIKNKKIANDVDALFGPAYKGIPLAVSTASALWNNHHKDVNYCFNRKEAKDHGEGGTMVGYKLNNNDKVLIIEDVITAGTAIRETLPQLKAAADVKIEGLIISVDRMEKGKGEKTAIEEIKADFDINTYPIVTVREVIESLHNKPLDGKVYITDDIREKMENYMKEYCI